MKMTGFDAARGMFLKAVATAALLVGLPAITTAQEAVRVGVATFYGPVSVDATQGLKACLHNHGARGKVKVRWTLLDNASSRAPEAERTVPIDLGAGACELFLPNVAKTFVVMLEVFDEASTDTSRGGGQHIPGALPSLQLTNRGGTTAIALLLPAVQKVREAASR
jgi:hypothetical protein